MSAALSFGHGANDAQKAMGVIAALLLASGHARALAVPLWVKVACGAALTLGTAHGRLADRPHDRPPHLPPAPDRRLRQPDASTAVILAAPTWARRSRPRRSSPRRSSASAAGRRRWRHVRWAVVRSIGLAWLLTLPGLARRSARSRSSSGGRRMSAAALVPAARRPTCSAMLRAQAAITVEGMDALVAWARGDAAAPRPAARLRAPGRRPQARAARGADRGVHRRRSSRRTSSSSRAELDEVLNSAKNTVREAEVMATGPDAAMAEMARELADGHARICSRRSRRSAHGRARRPRRRPTRARQEPAAPRARLPRRRCRRWSTVDDLREVAARRELYRRLARTSDELARGRRAGLVLGAEGTLTARAARRSPPRRDAAGRMCRRRAAAIVGALRGEREDGMESSGWQGSRPLWSSVVIVAMWMTVLAVGLFGGDIRSQTAATGSWSRVRRHRALRVPSRRSSSRGGGCGRRRAGRSPARQPEAGRRPDPWPPARRSVEAPDAPHAPRA